MKKLARLLCVLSASIAFAGCASEPIFPRAQIDRPYTLPTGGEIGVGIGHTMERQKDPYTGEVYHNSTTNFTDGQLAISLGENWNLLIPGFRAQAIHTDTDVLGFSFLMNFGTVSEFKVSDIGFSEDSNFVLVPSAEAYYRHKTSASFALEFIATYTQLIPLTTGMASGQQASLRAGPFFQLGDTTALSAHVGVVETRRLGYGGGGYASDIQLNGNGLVQYIMPVDLRFSWSIARKWDIIAGAEWARIGYANNYSTLSEDIGVILYW